MDRRFGFSGFVPSGLASRVGHARALLAIAAVFLAPAVLRAQDTTTTPGVRLGLSYQTGTKPGVIVLPVVDDDDDSLRTIE